MLEVEALAVSRGTWMKRDGRGLGRRQDVHLKVVD